MTQGGIRYLICTVPRSGSSFLCDLLQRTDRLGMRAGRTHRFEYMLPHVRSGFAGIGWSAATPAALLEAAFAQSATPNGVMGFKVMWHDFRRVLGRAGRPGPWQRPRIKNVERELASKVRFIWLRRRDTERQAISWTKALQAGAWSISRQPRFEGGYTYDYLWIETMRRKILNHDRRWAAFFNRAGIEPLTLHYEEYIADIPGTLARIASYLGVEPPQPVETAYRGHYRIQRDTVSEEWLARYQRDGKGPIRRSLAAVRSALLGQTWRRLVRSALSR